MSVPRFEICLDACNSIFEPGDEIRGHVLLDITGGRISRGLVLSCRGGSYVRINSTKRKLKYDDYVENREVFVTHDKFIAGDGREMMVFQPGSYTLEFSFCIPDKIPNTIHTLYGYVRYVIFCRFYEIEVPDQLGEVFLDPKGEARLASDPEIAYHILTVFRSYSIANVPGINQSQYEQAYKRLGYFLCGQGEVSFLFSIAKTGFCIGENIYVVADIRNMSKNLILYSEVAIHQTITYKAGGIQETVQRRICSTKKGNIPPHSSYNWDSVPLFVPSICDVSTEHCNIINLGYKTTFSIGIQAKLAVKRVQVDIPIIIGVNDNMNEIKLNCNCK